MGSFVDLHTSYTRAINSWLLQSRENTACKNTRQTAVRWFCSAQCLRRAKFCWHAILLFLLVIFILAKTRKTRINARSIPRAPILVQTNSAVEILKARHTKHKTQSPISLSSLNRVYSALFELRYVLFTLIERRSRHTDLSGSASVQIRLPHFFQCQLSAHLIILLRIT